MVLHGFDIGVGELIGGMKTRDLDVGLRTERFDRAVGAIEKIVVIEKITQNMRVNQ